MADDKKELVGALVIDPAWEIGVMMIEGARVGYMRFDHPEHGRLFFHVTRETLEALPAVAATVSGMLKSATASND